ncbi:DUF5995 family protein [Micromonospora sp. M51]|uniref:DUF5995 family protein n=1 Tax=Micromonospora sp. M51 TaxID=2824889 RepID=UPI001FFD8FE1|nr:DUF5995 family protein [Micromonospora sp. M51]
MKNLLRDFPADVPAVVDHLVKLQHVVEQLPPLQASSPLADFNKLYLTISNKVLEGLNDSTFADPLFVSRLDVEFAARYLDALRSWTDLSPDTPKAWSCLFERMRGPDARPLPSAAAGVNAHLNFDLPFALVATFEYLNSEPVDGSAQHHDYLELINLFADRVPGLRRGYLERWQLLIDMIDGEIDELYQGELIEYTRDVAWRIAQRLWHVRHDTIALDTERSRLDDSTAALGRLLLSPLGTFLQ